MKKMPDWLIAIISNALLGEIYPSIRAIAIEFSSKKELKLICYFDRIPTEDDHENIDIIATNIGAATAFTNQISSITTHCAHSELLFKDLNCFDGLVYCRREY